MRRPNPPLPPRSRLPFVLALVATGSASSLLVFPASAQTATPEAASASVNPSALSLAGQMDLARLVDLAAARLNLDVDYDAAVLRGSVTLRLDGPVPDDELWALTNRVLASRQFTTVLAQGSAASSSAPAVAGVATAIPTDEVAAPPEADGADASEVVRAGAARRGVNALRPSFTVVSLANAATLAPVTTWDEFRGMGFRGQAMPADSPRPGYMTLLVPLKHRAAREVIEPITKVLTKGSGTATALSDDRWMILSDLTPRIETALRVLELIDTPSAQVVIEEHPLNHLTAEQMVMLATQVQAKRIAVSGERIVTGASGSGGVSVLGGRGDMIASPDGDAVLLIASEAEIENLRNLVRQLDQREGVQTLTYAPRHFPAQDVAPLIEQTLSAILDDRRRLIVDDLTGSLILTATPTQHEQVRQLVARLDAVPPSARRPVRSFVIRNRSVTEVKAILEELARAGVLDAASADVPADASGAILGLDGRGLPAGVAMNSGAPTESATGSAQPSAATGYGESASNLSESGSRNAESSRGASERGAGAGSSASGPRDRGDNALVFAIDEGTNTLIAVGEPRVLAQIEALLRTIDVRQPQVMLEVLMVTLSESDTLDFGVELERLRLSDDLFVRLSSLFGLGTRNDDGDRTAGDASGFTGVVLDPGDFSIVLRALQTLNEGRSLSMPKLLVGNNHEATLDSVTLQPFASINASNTVSTTSFGGSADAGTVVTLKPQIAEGDHLVLDYSVSLSAFIGAAAAVNLPPPKQQNKVASIATIPDGHTIVVGGIELLNSARGTSQVPVVGDIPLIGELFKSRSNSNTRSRFYVFIRATVLRHRGFEDLKYLSERDVAEASVDDGWPDVMPRVIR